MKDLRGSDVLREFNARLARRWSIETGVIEGVYRIERGITELLIDRGIEAALIPHGSTDRPAADVVKILKDHQDALEGLFAFISDQRDLSVSYIRELHQQLCASQDTVVGMDPQGNRVEKKLRKGDWKKMPNNPHRQDGSVHEYCPPEHVNSEIENMVALHHQHLKDGVSPEVEAAWLHHRFTQIHPFEDGNGRVARALASLVLLRAELFPFIIDRDEQGAYISALEVADRDDDLRPLIRMVAKQQQGALLAALDLSRDVMRGQEAADSLEKTLAGAAEKIRQKQYKKQQDDFQAIETRTNVLIELCNNKLRETSQELKVRLVEFSGQYEIQTQQSDSDQGHWYHYQVAQLAQKLRYVANTHAWHRWARLRISGDPGGHLVFTFHQSGQDFRGVFMATAFYEARGNGEGESSKVVTPIVDEGFAITLNEDEERLHSRFKEWLDMAVAAGVLEWSNSI
ncbi:MAG: Fic family protein [Candidatus Sumerlaeia bacterium]|nr:Fic family protein [Candidatus Sumerlaeia bacterium]